MSFDKVTSKGQYGWNIIVMGSEYSSPSGLSLM